MTMTAELRKRALRLTTTMRLEGILKLLKVIGIETVQAHPRYVQISCPFAPETHGKGTDRHPSLSIRVEDNGRSGWKCFGCGLSGYLFSFATRWGQMAQVNPMPLLDMIDKEENSIEAAFVRLDSRWNAVWAKEQRAVEKEDFEVFAEAEIEQFPADPPQYMIDRGIAAETCKAWGIRFDAKWSDRDGVRPRVVFPVRRRDGKLVGMVGRATDDNKDRKYYNYWNFPKSRFLFGENMIQRKGRVVLVEGLIDTIKWWEYGIPTVGLMGMEVSDEQAKLLLDYDAVYLALDQDAGGASGTEKAVERFRNQMSLLRIPFPEGKNDPKMFTREEAYRAIDGARLVL